MDAKKAKSYVYYYAEKYPSLAQLKQGIAIHAVFCYIYLVFAVLTSEALIYAVPSLLLTFIYTFWVCRLQKNGGNVNSFSLRFLISGAYAVHLAAIFLIMQYLFLRAAALDSPFNMLAVPTLLMLFTVFCNAVIALNVKSGKYLKNRKSKDTPLAGFIVGAVLLIVMVILSIFRSDVLIKVFVFSPSIMSVLFLLGTHNFLKLYWCKKYDINSDERGNNTSPALLTKSDKPISARSVVILTVVILFAVLTLAGVYVNNR